MCIEKGPTVFIHGMKKEEENFNLFTLYGLILYKVLQKNRHIYAYTHIYIHRFLHKK